MFRLSIAAGLLALAIPASADTITAEARVDTVTIYPGLATITRLATLDVPAGRHEIIIPDLPRNLATEGLRVSGPQDVRIGAVNLAYDRLPVTPDLTSPEVQAAKDEVERLENVLRERASAIAAIRLRVQAAEEQIAFLQSLSQASAGETLTASAITDIQSLARMVGEETLAVRQAAFAAEEEAKAAERAREDDVEALTEAQRALAALMAPEEDGSVLTFTLDAPTDGEITIDISSLEGYANWSPVYDMRLTTSDAAKIDLDRAVVVSQQTGQDWLDVKLVLSTARPGEQIAPGEVWAPVRRIISEEELELDRNRGLMAVDEAMPMTGLNLNQQPRQLIADQEKADGFAPFAGLANFSGATVTYTYPGRVDIRNGVDDLRLPLDTLEFDAEVWAEAVPSLDDIAFRMAEFTNATDEILLPGQAMIFADGTMIGFSHMPLLAGGADTTMGFGPLDGIRLTRTTPNRSEGDVGVFSSANQLTENAVLKVENLTGQDWKILLRDAVPYSEQDDLEVEISATPAITRTNPENQRGILEWDLDIGSGQSAEVKLDYTLTWPNGYVLQ